MRDVPVSAVEFIKSFEGLRLNAYQDYGGVWTIGYGSTSSVRKGQRITEDEAERRLLADIQLHSSDVEALITVPIADCMFGALTSFCYNLGGGALQRSTLRMKLNRYDYLGASNEFWKWRRAGGVILDGLVRRREAERLMFLGVNYDFE